jgi:hypothetical protein
MADTPTQDGRVGKLATPLGEDKLCLTRFEGTEAIGELFEDRIEAISTDPNSSVIRPSGRAHPARKAERLFSTAAVRVGRRHQRGTMCSNWSVGLRLGARTEGSQLGSFCQN